MYKNFVDTGKSVKFVIYNIINGVSKDEPEVVIPYTEKLAECPFCGSDAEIVGRSLYRNHSIKVRCKKCHCGTRLESDAPSVTGVAYTLPECLNEVITLWNRRSI